MMKEERLFCGIDIPNETFDVCLQKTDGGFQSETLQNNKTGFAQLLKLGAAGHHFVMESTGVYHLPLCFYLHDKKSTFSVVNALQIKRYIQMHLERNKSDKKDAKYICNYGIDQQPKPYQMPDNLYFVCSALNNSIQALASEITAFKNKVHSLEKVRVDNGMVIRSFRSIIKKLQEELVKLEQGPNRELALWQPELVALVGSVVGIGKRATSILIVSTQGFKNTGTYQQLISHAGLGPREYSSGTSIKGRSKICKSGGGQLRHTLYMCAMNAKKNNPACKQLFDRLVAKGKNKKLAIIAVCNKLLKQVFAVVKSGVLYDKNYLQKTA